MNEFLLTNRSALVTGSTQGIGQGIAIGLENAGAKVIRHGLPQNDSDAPRTLRHDLLDPASPKQLIEASTLIDPDLDILVCNAGSFFDVPFLEMDEAIFAKTLQLNIAQHYFLIQAFSRKLIAQKRPGTVVIIGSTNGFFAEPDSTAYDISKGALVMMARTLAYSLAPYGIRVNAIAPGLVRTPLTNSWMDREPDKMKRIEERLPAKRVGCPEDIAGVCSFLCSNASRYIFGQTLVVDGGRTLSQLGGMTV